MEFLIKTNRREIKKIRNYEYVLFVWNFEADEL